MAFAGNLTQEEEHLTVVSKMGRSHKVRCPWCADGRSKIHQSREELTVTRDAERIVYKCHHCTAEGIIVTRPDGVSRNRFPPARRPEPPKKTRNVSDLKPLNAEHYTFFRTRGISPETVDHFKVFAHNTAMFSGVQRPAVGFPYFAKPGVINAAKFRATNSKEFMSWQSPDTFFGIEHVNVGDDLYIVEGENDVLAMKEAGFNAISCPFGAPTEVSEEGRIKPEDDKKYRCVWNAKEHVDAAKRVILATDNDVPGEALAEELARRVGKAKCYQVKWVGGKDANDVLLALGVEGVKAQIEEAEPWPVAGLFDTEHFHVQVRDLYSKGLGRGASTGFPDVDELYTIADGQVTIVTGIPSSGKSEFIDMLMINLAEQLRWSFCVCSFENEPRLHIAKLITKKAGMPFFQNRFGSRLNNDDMEATFAWIDEHFVFGYQDDGSLSDIDSILERIRVAVMRYGVRGAVIDPYNYISRDRSMSETDWISDMLTKIKVFASAHGIHIWLVAHPTKMQKNLLGKYSPPGGYDISGSGHWFNKADCGLTVHREKDDPLDVQIHIWKCRFSWIGKQGEARVTYDLSTTRYYSKQSAVDAPHVNGTHPAFPGEGDRSVPWL